MKIVTIHEAKTHFSRLIREALSGEEIVVARGSTPLVRLVPISRELSTRRFGTARGLAVMGADFEAALADFDEYREG
ncbi:MAG: type II toxin-antitoxin system prevent-host-death family antitoxin [Thermoanaerobaculia bacterium]